jgi:hypothetical protein
METISSIQPDIFLRDKALISAALRLRHITGFVTTLSRSTDNRPAFFSRYNHVQRAAYVAADLASLLESDRFGATRLIWLHDLNRWPFAHNSEKGFFDQAANVESYFARFGEAVSAEELADLSAFHRRALEELSEDGRCALLADFVTGVFEDPMMVVVGLNVSPKVIPSVVLEALGWTDEAIGWELGRLRRGFSANRKLSSMVDEFNDVFKLRIGRFLDDRRGTSPEELARILFDMATTIKATFLRPIVFPINNEAVCHSNWIKRVIVEPFLRAEPRASELLLEWDEQTLLERLASGWLELCDIEPVFPDLDYVERERVDIAFLNERRVG